MKKVLKKILARSLKPFLLWYLKKERDFSYQGIKIKVLPGVFHPGFFFSTKILLHFLAGADLENKSLLELGAGTGLIAIWSSKRGARVTAVDISEKSIQNIILNREFHRLSFGVFSSDLFANVPKQVFDFIIINPPYFKADVKSETDHAWYAGAHYEYFERLFGQIGSFMDTDSNVIMVLSEDCDIKTIIVLAEQNNLTAKVVRQEENFIENNFVFRIFKNQLL